MPIDLDRVRTDTPGVDHVAHFNNAGSALPPAVVTDAVVQYLQREAEIGGYEVALERADDLQAPYTMLARLLGASADEIAIVESATRAWNAAFTSIRFTPGDRVIVSKAEYTSNALAVLQARDLFGVEVVVAPDDEHGQTDVDALATLVDDSTKLVVITHVPTSGGLVNPAAEIGAITRDAGVLYLLDACQSAGQIPLDVDAIGCDMLSLTGRKFLRGPRGTGALYVRRSALGQLDAPIGLDTGGGLWTSPLEWRPDPGMRRFEQFEMGYADKVGLGVAVDYALEVGIDAIAERNAVLSARLREALDGLPGVTVRDQGEQRSAIVTFTVDGQPAAEIKNTLAAASPRINVSVATAASAQFDFPERNLTDVVRASVHYYNSDRELDHLIAAVATC